VFTAVLSVYAPLETMLVETEQPRGWEGKLGMGAVMVKVLAATCLLAMELITILNRCHRFRRFVYQHARCSSDKKSIEVAVRPRKGSAVICSRCHQPALGLAAALFALLAGAFQDPTLDAFGRQHISFLEIGSVGKMRILAPTGEFQARDLKTGSVLIGVSPTGDQLLITPARLRQ
jgi:hypothetical protein